MLDYEQTSGDSLNTGNPIQELNFPMIECGSDEAQFHTRNDPNNPYQRPKVIQRTGHGVGIQCNLMDIVHGAISAESNYWATILVFQFRFDPEKKARRVAEATIELTFDTMNAKGTIPEIDSISFDGHYSFSSSKASVTDVRGAEGSIGASFGANANTSLKWEKTVGRETAHAATISGNKLVVGNIGPDRLAKWTLLENSDQKKGVPTSIQVAIRVKRMDEALFSCHVNLTCKADRWTAVQDFFGGLPKDDPVLLDPGKEPTNKLMNYDVEELGAVDLDRLSAVSPTKILLDSEKMPI
ncbi:uncharacterized protein B0J16DRAFT_343127 [Fusarium flagelliforme]|uniref:uncharacterized protein n=1 Tax=Fusarium flagelliforme TaxID=2675880 RepID=UPI001E8DB3D2|nr:uncharacterized protein B0J16DRAFT_343127 [Fusarium flagelliforme]KAH7186029.1 hypothetical protein B0J16DRAFT_343127 [Fusarium flagelliforme]